MAPHRSTQSRQDAYRRGLRAEKIARILLILKGYKIIAERYQNSFGEIDILALKGDTLALVEVKARSNLRDCLESITPVKQARQIKAAKSLLAYPGTLAPFTRNPNLSIRFDVICIVPWKVPVHLISAWQAE